MLDELRVYREKISEATKEMARLDDAKRKLESRVEDLENDLFSTFRVGDKLLVVDEDAVSGVKYWFNGEIVEIRDVEIDFGGSRIDVWDAEKYSSEYIYLNELAAFERISE